MSFRGRLVVAPPLRERKTVMNPGIEFDFTGSAGPPEQGAQLFHHRQWRQVVVFSASNVEFARLSGVSLFAGLKA
jgi:ATP sulfurylase